MLKTFFTDEETTWSDIDVILSTNAKNTMGITCEQRGSFSENWNYRETYNKEEAVYILGHIMRKDDLEDITLMDILKTTKRDRTGS